MEAVARSEPNSRTILVTSQASIVIAPLINSKLPTVPSRDLIPVVQLATYPQALLVRQDSPFKTLKNLLDHATKKPGGIVFCSSGNGSYGHLLGAQLAISSRTSLIHVPYRGMASAMVDLAGGQLDAVIVDFRSEEQQSKGIRALAVTGAQRVASAPEVPTFAELGFEGFESAWVGAFFPAGTDPAIVSRLNTEAQKVLQVASFKSELQKGGMATGTLNGERFAGLINTQSRRLAQVVRQTGIKAD